MTERVDGAAAGRVGVVELDGIDIALLRLLAADARTSLRSLGAEVGLSGPAVADRMARLGERGVIHRFTVDIDWAALGMPTLTHISLQVDKARDIDHVVTELRQLDRVEEISIVTGTTDLLVRARVADLADLRQLLVQGIWAIQGVERVESTVAVETETVPTFTENMIGLLATEPPVEDGGR